jgi:predicted TIM-barrel enzyme
MTAVSTDPTTAETMERILRSAVRERERLLHAGANEAVLEANRRAIAYWQARLAEALAKRARV